ncbi:flagellar hook-length control protein FliK [Brevundimonas sp.]|uniref:flagellar hook-length control protein FliK n=1 Tax=Brevundimonas sp. TaxID=1871086 RepID=UPI002C41F0FC|nr:flagellar hook-length control protein FliK [Brevundimonas sp.]HWQ88228.1 flagellar hook-length control protein FliK [Brevundimonas sp.]
MSALALPSVTAPAATSAPQGSTGAADTTGFKGLLATCLNNDAGTGAADDLEVAAANDDGDLAPATAPPLAPIAIPIAIPISIPVAIPGALVVAQAPAPESQTAAAAGIPAEPLTPEPDASPLVQNGGVQPAPVMPRSAAAPEPVKQTMPLVASDSPESAEPEVGAPVPDAEAKAAKAAPAVGAAAVQTAPPAPPLRALAERTSRPLDAPVDKPADTPASGSGATEARERVAAVSTATLRPERAAGPAEAAPKPAADTVAGTDDLSIDVAPAGETAAATTATTAQIRETSLSGLSRATIDATAQIAAQILRKLEGRSTRFEMALTPDDLGRVDVKLDIDSEGRLAARLAFDNPAAATDLRGRVDDLRRELEDAGFHLADDAFEFAERDSGSSSFDRGQDARHDQNRAFAAASRRNAEIDVAQPPRWMALTLSPAGVDLKV